jgi:trigger factor
MGFFVSNKTIRTVEILFEKKENSSALLTISIEQGDYQSDYQLKVKDYSKRVQMKGFRPGKVPPALVEKMYGSALKSEAINSVLNKSIDQYLKDNDIDVLGDLIAEESFADPATSTPDLIHFSFLLAIRPEITYPALETISLVYPEIEVAEDRINDFITDLQKRYGQMTDGEAIVEGDLIKGQLVAKDGSFETESSFPFSKIKEGYQSQFLGKKVGESIEFPIEEAFEKDEIRFVTGTFKEKDREFSGLFTLTITNISTSSPAELTTDFFDKAVGKGRAADEAEFRLRVRELFADTYSGESEAYFQMAVEKFFYENSQLVLAEDVVNKVITRRSEGKMSAEELASFLPRYIRSMKMSLIKGKLAEDFNLRITEEDLLEAARKQIASDFQQMGYGNLGDDFIEKYAATYLDEKDKNNRDRMAEKSLTAKISSLLLEKGKIVRNVVTIEKFNQLVEELN